MEDEIKQSLNSFSDEFMSNTKYNHVSRYNKSNSFTQLSDWTNKHKFINQSIVLPRILENPYNQITRKSQSTMSNYQNYKKSVPSGIKSIDIKFGLPQGLKGFQKSFYQNYVKQKSERRGLKIKPSEYLSIQQQLKIHSSLQRNTNQSKLQHETARQSIINRVMNRKNRLKRQHFLQQYLIANQMSPPKQKQKLQKQL